MCYHIQQYTIEVEYTKLSCNNRQVNLHYDKIVYHTHITSFTIQNCYNNSTQKQKYMQLKMNSLHNPIWVVCVICVHAYTDYFFDHSLMVHYKAAITIVLKLSIDDKLASLLIMNLYGCLYM